MTEPEDGKLDSKEDDTASSNTSSIPKISIDSGEYIPVRSLLKMIENAF